MREILFRGKRVDNGECVYGSLMIKHSRCHILETDPDIDNNGNFVYCIVIPETVCQFTGLTDKNGTKIFGDDLRKDIHGKIFRIYEMPGGFAIKAKYWMNEIFDLAGSDVLIMDGLTDAQTRYWIINSTEAAGNIHDNPELLN